jgi:hypothetical protein
MAIDSIAGIIAIFYIVTNTTTILSFFHSYFSGLHIEMLNKDVEWLMGIPAGL